MTTHLPSTPRCAGTAEHADSSMASEAVTRVLVRPVFLAVGDRRRRLLRLCGFLGAAACLAYLVMISFSLLSSPGGRAPASVQPAAPARTAPARTAKHVGLPHGTVTPTTIPDRLVAPQRTHPAAGVVLADGITVNQQAFGISRASATRPAPISVRTSATTRSRVDRDDTRKPSASPANRTRVAGLAAPARSN